MSAPSRTQYQLDARLRSFGFEPQAATATVALRTRGERTRRAALAAGAGVGAASVGLFIPLAHLFLVPGFLIGGTVLAVRRAREARTLVRVHGACPACRAPVDVAPGGALREGREIRCPACHRMIAVEVDESSWPVEARG